ncbi:metalloregulator ArsR/SmtB family transcription factor [Phormidium yuhuli AB48]|uniref:Metalloregulator ArsR/SmtB family transcription factor n=1 Tax=Phormidium yuhuli AB48 TaxID=2940671 RepID=A0ABY5APH1_9CYAN|nr:metalloregulator ArsR/SmtB family transcription factor [Phormidium yuhuli]USR90905.1 metalloregulator ArsR/SmtB family transcription factor [Phormidium yuhuli AB48]
MKSSLAKPSNHLILGFRALSDPLRLQIIEHLCDRELCVCELCDRLNTPQSKLSFHLKVLKEAQLVHPRQDGRWIYYRLNLAQVLQLEKFLQSLNTSTAQIRASHCP